MTDATEKSFYYLGDSLKNKCLFLEEAENLKGDNGFAYVIRVLISEGYLKKTVTENHFGNWYPVDYVVEGPISFMTTSVHEKLEKQFEDRVFVIRPEASSEQVNQNVHAKLQRAAGEKRVIDERIITAWKLYNLSLSSYEVVIPFADKIFKPGQHLPVSANRAYSRIISAITAVTIFHQKQRHIDKSGRLVAEMADYAIVYQLFRDSLLESIGLDSLLNDPKLKIILDAGKISSGELAKQCGVSAEAISKWSKRQIENDTLVWCDENGQLFGNEALLKKAKYSGKAYLRLPAVPGLPSPFEITGEPAWDKGGRLFEIYDLHLDSYTAYIDPADPEPLGVRTLKRKDVDLEATVEPEFYDLEVIPGKDDYGTNMNID